MASLRGEAVDRPCVNFYEIGGFVVNPSDPDVFNIYNSPSWRPLLEVAERETDLIRLVKPEMRPGRGNALGEFQRVETWREGRSKFWRTTLKVGGRVLTGVDRRDAEIDTIWHIEHLIKDVEDLKAYLQLPDEVFEYDYGVENLRCQEAAVGDRGIVLVDMDNDAVCNAFGLFSMADFMVVAMTEQALFHRLLEKLSRPANAMVKEVCEKFPGHLWRVCGAEVYAEPYLPPTLFRDYLVRYQRPIIEMIHEHEGLVRIHCHGRLRAVIADIVNMGADALDPLEPPGQGDMELSEIRREYGERLTLFGNLEISDIENLEEADFEVVVRKSLADGTSGRGKGFVLMPSASPYGREITPRTMANYETMVRLAKESHRGMR